MQTIKQDWLNDALAANGCFVSGHASTEDFIGLRARAEIRFARLGATTVFFLTVQAPEPDYQERYLAAFLGSQLGWLRSVFHPIIQLFYAPGDDTFDVFFPSRAAFKRLSFEELARYVARFDEKLTANPGTEKSINVSMNDIFQHWTRQYLSRSCVVADLDAFTFSMHQAVFFELKRVKEDLRTWRPYVDDRRNYQALDAIARAHGGVAVTLAYQAAGDPAVALHRHLAFNAPGQITGQVLLTDKTAAVQRPLALDFSAAESYTSTHTRQR